MNNRIWLPLVVGACLLAAAGCSDRNSATGSAMAQPDATQLSSVALQRLVEADKLDGTADHVVERCFACALGMDGKPEWVVQTSGYQCRCCSETCRAHVERDIESIIAATKIPKSE